MAPMGDERSFTLPKVPAPHQDFISYIKDKDVTQISKAIEPYNAYEAKLREGFAQYRGDEALQDPNVNAVPVFGGQDDVLLIRSRSLDDMATNEKYIMPLSAKARKPDQAPATVGSIQDFKKNFNLFSESSLVDLDWNNVVAAGSAVVTPLLPVPKKHAASKKALRHYYHEDLAPSSDVDLFIWGLDEEAALEKIKQIESSVRNAILEEVTTVRTKNAITIVSHYPVRHVQIVLRLYKSISEILTGFDVDCSCFAYDGEQVYGTPRGIAAFMTQTNKIDLSRRSPSYESRLSKYARRGFEVYCSELDRSKIDPTIFERSFARTMGLARLLVLEQLPKPNDRESYLHQRREERGRPTPNTYWSRQHNLQGNFKDHDPDDVAEWVYDDEVSNYHSFTVPYGPKYHAKKIEKLLYTKDLLLNAEWNHKRDRTVDLHRHPCFIGPVDSVLHDCCGSCPEPKTDEEREVAEEERKIYITGDLQFMQDDPGRQTIGSFNPLTADDWTEMAYVGNTEELCQKICDGDIYFVRDWCTANPDSINRRDHTGRTPLHVATQSSTTEIVRCLVESGARIVARLVDGMTALHLAALRGETEMVQILLEQSEENEILEDEKEEQRRSVKHPNKQTKSNEEADRDDENSDGDDEDDDEDLGSADTDEDMATTEGSFVKVGKDQQKDMEALDDSGDSDPDIYDVNVVAWDAPVSPLHLAILAGHIPVIKLLVDEFGADVLLPIKILNEYSRQPEHAIMALVLASQLSEPTSLEAVKTLFSLGASSAQADMKHTSAFHYLVARSKVNLLKACFEEDKVAARGTLDHVIVERAYWRGTDAVTPLTTAISSGKPETVAALLDEGAKPTTEEEDFAVAYNMGKEQNHFFLQGGQDISKIWRENVMQPVLKAVDCEMPEIIIRLLDAGADVNTLDTQAHTAIGRLQDGQNQILWGNSLLDCVDGKMKEIKKALRNRLNLPMPPKIDDDNVYLGDLEEGSYEHWHISKSAEVARSIVKEWEEERNKRVAKEQDQPGQKEKLAALEALKDRFEELRVELLERGAKKLEELQPKLSKEPKGHDSEGENPDEGKAFEPKVSFKASSTDALRAGYMQLFEAAWKNDISKIKELTLANWGPELKHGPLSITTQDFKGFNPFMIAVYRRHFEAAKLILDIVDLQFKDADKDSKPTQYRMAEEDSEYDSADSEDDELGISSRIVDDTYTYENITALRRSVGSKVSAWDMLRQSAETWYLVDEPMEDAYKKLDMTKATIILNEGQSSANTLKQYLQTLSYTTDYFTKYAIACGDIEVLRFWLRCCQAAGKMKQSSNYDGSTPSIVIREFDFALRGGYIDQVAEMITIVGAQLPLEALVKESGVQTDDKPKYYQGLSIGGKKMKNWARERSGMYEQNALYRMTSPLLLAAEKGELTSVEWLLSDTPLRLYKQYGVNNADDPRLKILAKTHGGFEQAVGTWLKQRSNLALHGAILSSNQNNPKSLEVINYLLSIMPSSVDLPASKNVLTPLSLAFLTGRLDAAHALIKAGADQTTRDSQGKNLIHLALRYLSKASSPDPTKELESLLSLIDKRLLPSMMTERCRDAPTGLTPLAYWLTLSSERYYYYGRNIDTARENPEIFTTLCKDFGGAEALEMMDGSGQFPLHQAVKRSCAKLVELMLEFNPGLLVRENAMGQTPMELAESLHVRDATKGNPDIKKKAYVSLTKRKAEQFVPKDTSSDSLDGGEEEDEDEDNQDLEEESRAIRKTYRICQRAAKKHPEVMRKRKLVSVIEAREVAKRLADKMAKGREIVEDIKEEGEEGQDERDERDGAGEDMDEVDGWLAGRQIYL